MVAGVVVIAYAALQIAYAFKHALTGTTSHLSKRSLTDDDDDNHQVFLPMVQLQTQR